MQRSFDYEDIKQQVLAFLTSLGIQPYDERDIILDDELHRYRTHDDKPSHTSGAICIHIDGWPAGFVQDWRKGIKENWKYDISGLDDEQRDYFSSEEFKKKCEERDRLAAEKRKQAKLKASRQAKLLWDALKPAQDNHPYLQRKHVKAHGLRFHKDSNSLAVPLTTIDGIVRSIQWIPAEQGAKKTFFAGASLDGAFFSLGLDTLKNNPKQTILLGEGFATMAKIYELTGLPVVAAVSCHRLKEVAKILHEAFPESEIIMAADNDLETEQTSDRGINPGVHYAEEVVKAKLSAGIIVPEFTSSSDGTDWDDYALIHGDDYTSSCLIEKINEVETQDRRAYYKLKVQELGELKYESFSEFIKPLANAGWLIDGWIPSEGMIMLFAPSGSGKGFISLDMAFAIASKDIADWHSKKMVKHGDVIYFAGEGQRGMRKRCAGLCAELGIPPDEVKMHIISDTLAIDDKDPRAGVERAIVNIGNISLNPVLVIFDTTNRYMSGDENKTVEATSYIRSCDLIAREFHCAVMTIHHAGQSQEVQNRARGSSVFKASVDIELKVSKEMNVLTLEMTKSKDSELQPAMKFFMRGVEVPGYFKANGDSETTCVLVDVDEALASTSLTSDNNSKSRKPNASEEQARQSYREAAFRHGRLIYDEEYEQELVCVTMDDWREVHYSLSTANNVDAKRQQFKRAKTKLQDTLGILIERQYAGETYCCLKPTGDGYEMEILLHLRRKKDERDKEA